jgi:hypothetical protein
MNQQTFGALACVRGQVYKSSHTSGKTLMAANTELMYQLH